MQHWTELRTALMLARHGTVSAAAEALGVHRATVNRHIDTLEAEFRVKLFQRHARGYTLTESGQEMLDVVGRADEMFADLAGRSRGRSATLSGDLVVTALSGIAPLIVPALREFHFAHPKIKLEFAASADLARLEHGEAHVAIRAGAKPDTPDYVVLPFRVVRFGLFASKDYVERAGIPRNEQFEGHSFVGSVGIPVPRPFTKWMDANVPPGALSLRATDLRVIESAVSEGLGIGFLAEPDVENRTDLVEIVPPRDEWAARLWIVTHVDLHRTAKVQAFLHHLKAVMD